MEEHVKKLKEYLRTHLCLDYSAKILMEESIKLMEKCIENETREAQDNE